MTSVAARPSPYTMATPPPRSSSRSVPSSDDDIAGRLLASALCTPPVPSSSSSKHAAGSAWTPPSSSRPARRADSAAQLQSPSPLSPDKRRRHPPHPRQPAATYRPAPAPRRSTAPASPCQAGAPSTSTSLETAGATPPARGPPERRAPFGLLDNVAWTAEAAKAESSAKRLDFAAEAANPWAIVSDVRTPDSPAMPASATQSPKRKPETEAFSGSGLELRTRDTKDARLSGAPELDEASREASRQMRALLGLGLAPAFEAEEGPEGATLRRGPAPKAAARSATSTRRRVGGTVLRQPAAAGTLRRTGSPKTPPAPLPLAAHAAGMAGLGLGIAGVESMDESVAAPSSPKDLDSPGSSASSVPSIIITPPAVIAAQTMTRSASDLLVPVARPYAGAVLSFAEPASVCSIVLAPIDTQLGSEHGGASDRTDSSMTSFSPLAWFSPPVSPTEACDKSAALIQFPTPPTSPSLRAQRMRETDDAAAFNVLAARLDDLLSGFFYCYSTSQSHLLCRQFVGELRDALTPSMDPSSAQQVPSLVRTRWVGEGDAREWIAAEWCAKWHAQAVEQIMEHVVSGIMALLADARAPDLTSESMARLCLYLRNELRGLDSAPEVSFHPGPLSELYTNGLAASPVLSGERDTPPHMDLEAHGGSALAYIDTPGFWGPDLADEPADLAQPATVFTAQLSRTLDALLERGAAVRERASHLTVPSLRRGSRKRLAAATAHVDAARRARDNNLKLATKGEISEDEFRSRERQQAAVGSKKDSFADIETVRFVGDLYRHSMLDIAVVQDWLDRLLFETVFPGVPSAYELEAGCALLLTVGSTLETASFNEARGASPTSCRRSSDGGSTCSSPESDSPRTPQRASSEEKAPHKAAFFGDGAVLLANKAPANHWINHSPETTLRHHHSRRRSSVWRAMTASPSSASESGSDSPGSLGSPPLAAPEGSAQATLDATMLRLREVLDIPEISAPTKDWCREVIAYKARGWRKPVSVKLKSPPRIAEARKQPGVSLA